MPIYGYLVPQSHYDTGSPLPDMADQSQVDFHATGSRYFGNFGVDSDWDFFAEDTPDAQEWLREKGFVKLTHPEMIRDNYDRDYLLSEVWEYTWRSFKVQVQLVSCYYTKKKAQEIIKTCPFLPLFLDRISGPNSKTITSRKARQAMWYWAYGAAEQ